VSGLATSVGRLLARLNGLFDLCGLHRRGAAEVASNRAAISQLDKQRKLFHWIT
jgi:hypothetical protein